MPNNQPFIWKTCTKCGALLIANKTNFRTDKKGKYGLRANCNECERKHKQTKEYKEYEKCYKERTKERQREYSKQYRQTEKYKEYDRKRKQTEEYKEKKKKIDKLYKQRPEVKLKHNMQNHNRRAKEKQGKGIQSYKIAQEILNEWFDNSCAYSGKELTNDTINWDHIIPLKKDGVNEIWNLIPSYCTYNNQKNSREPYKWYKEQEYYDEDRLNYIIYYQKVMYWNFANKDSKALVLITGEIITYEGIEEEYGILEGAE